MSYLELKTNCDIFLKLINGFPISANENSNFLRQNYIKQNIVLLTDILLVSLNHLKKIQEVKSANDVIDVQLQLSDEVNKKITYIAQNFLNNSLRNVTTDDERLHVHCDMATD